MVEKNTMWNAKPHITRSEMRSSLNTSNFIWTTCSCLPLLSFGYFGVFFAFFVYASKRYKYILFYFLVIFDMNLGSLWYFELQQLAPTTYTTVIPGPKVFHSSFYFAFSLRILFDNQFCGCSNFSVSLLYVCDDFAASHCHKQMNYDNKRWNQFTNDLLSFKYFMVFFFDID